MMYPSLSSDWIEIAGLNFTYWHGPHFDCSSFKEWELPAYDNRIFIVGVIIMDLYPDVTTLIWLAETEGVVPINISVEMNERLITSNSSVSEAEFGQIDTSIGATWSVARAPRTDGGYNFVAMMVFNNGLLTGTIIVDERRCNDCDDDWRNFAVTLKKIEFTDANCHFEDALTASSVLFYK